MTTNTHNEAHDSGDAARPTMRSEEGLREVYIRLDEQPEREQEEDTFKHGFLIGKIVTLEWVLNEGAPSSDMGINYDFEGWRRECKDAADKLRREIKGED